MLDERDYMKRYEPREDETTLAPIIIKYGAAPIPDPSTPEGRHELDLNGTFFMIFIVLLLFGMIFFPIK